MTSPPSQDVTELLRAWSDGDKGALERLVPLVHKELHRLARHYMAGERPGHTLQVTALVNEAYLRLIDASQMQWQNRAHFFGVAAQLMRQILVDFARSRQSQKRGGEVIQVPFNEALVVSEGREANLVALDDALKDLAEIDPRRSQLVELRFFGGLSVQETAEVMKTSPRTILREWSLAQAWLYRELSKATSKSDE
ncbi:MAG TPA: sigma-70 family RNA polymerase sigma factor [Terriglobia bacterium]|nr:sigma-70 family RNA polymerase sigma factor [Terriglobia bacterium]